MGAVSVTVSGGTSFSDACGWADAEWEIKNTSDTRFRIASITKEFTAAAILLLHEWEVVVFRAIGTYLPDLPESWRSATIHQILTHTSGIPIPDYGTPAWERSSALVKTPQELVDLVREKPLMFAHGTKFAYNNTGYFVLGMLVEKLSGMKYENFIQKRILDPLGMKDSGCDDAERIILHKAQG